MSTCPATTTWPDLGVRLVCALPAGHNDEHWGEFTPLDEEAQ